jgi:predicted dehydrogenase
MKKMRIAVVGLRFGEDFPPIYRNHPDVEYVGICDINEPLLNAYGEQFGFDKRHKCFDEVINSKLYDAVHLTTPIHTHAEMAIKAMNAGLHCACTVPAATTIEELREIVATQKRTGKKYMMMETSVNTRQFLYVKDLVENGKFGRIQLMKGAHYQDMENWPSYWMGLPPMHYSTHAIAPLLAIAGTRATKVHCFGSGTMREELTKQYGNPFPAETAIFQLENSDVSIEVSRTLFETTRSYVENFNVYGEKMSFEWYIEDEQPVVFERVEENEGRGRSFTHKVINTPDRADLLPSEIRNHTMERVCFDAANPHLSVIQGGNHHGSHPHMVDQFVKCIIDDTTPPVDAITAANWTAPGICAHLSAMNNGQAVEVPDFLHI